MSRIASAISAYPAVRAALLQRQRDFAGQSGGAVLDGRDIGTVVAPDADVKLFVTALPEFAHSGVCANSSSAECPRITRTCSRTSVAATSAIPTAPSLRWSRRRMRCCWTPATRHRAVDCRGRAAGRGSSQPARTPMLVLRRIIFTSSGYCGAGQEVDQQRAASAGARRSGSRAAISSPAARRSRPSCCSSRWAARCCRPRFRRVARADRRARLRSAFLLNIAIILFGWRRSKDLKEALDAYEAAERLAQRNANTDPTTGLANRRELMHALDDALEAKRPRASCSFSISTISSGSTTFTATSPATSCCKRVAETLAESGAAGRLLRAHRRRRIRRPARRRDDQDAEEVAQGNPRAACDAGVRRRARSSRSSASIGLASTRQAAQRRGRRAAPERRRALRRQARRPERLRLVRPAARTRADRPAEARRGHPRRHRRASSCPSSSR